MSYYDHAVMIALQLGPWKQHPEPSHNIPARHRNRRIKRLERGDHSPGRPEPEAAKNGDGASREAPGEAGWRLMLWRIAAMLPMVQSKGLTGINKS